MPDCSWTGASGRVYTYAIHPIGEIWNDVAGNYIFAKQTEPSRWAPVYIGETQSFQDRLPNHNELPCILRNGGTHIHVPVNRASAVRLAEEADLLANHNPPCNG
jgi:hypothetical protein